MPAPTGTRRTRSRTARARRARSSCSRPGNPSSRAANGRRRCWGSRAAGSTAAPPHGPSRTGCSRPGRRGSASRSARGSRAGCCARPGASRSVSPKFFQSVMDPRHIARSTEQFEPVHMGDLALAGDDVAGQAVGLPEVGVPRTDHAPDVLPVAFVVEELDDLLGHGTAAVAPAIGRDDQDVVLVDDEVLILRVERDPASRPPELLDEAVGIAGHRGAVDELSHADASRAGQIAVAWRWAPAPATALILSGRKPDQWSSEVMTTGAWT